MSTKNIFTIASFLFLGCNKGEMTVEYFDAMNQTIPSGVFKGVHDWFLVKNWTESSNNLSYLDSIACSVINRHNEEHETIFVYFIHETSGVNKHEYSYARKQVDLRISDRGTIATYSTSKIGRREE